jgi:hypothetical protein
MSMLYGDLTGPTAVTHAVTARLLSPNAQNLVVAKASLLQVFRIQTSVRETQLRHAHTARNSLGDAVANAVLAEDGGEDFLGDDSQVQLLRQETVGQLVLVDEVHMSGTISGLVCLGPLQSVPSESDCIAISFMDAKVDSQNGAPVVLIVRFQFCSGNPPSIHSQPSQSISMNETSIALFSLRNRLVTSSKTTTVGA